MYPYLGETPGDYRELGYGTEGAGVARNGSLVIPRVSRDHAGFYLCQASNGIGPGLSKLIRLTVHGKIFTQPRVTVVVWLPDPGIPGIRIESRWIIRCDRNRAVLNAVEHYAKSVRVAKCFAEHHSQARYQK